MMSKFRSSIVLQHPHSTRISSWVCSKMKHAFPSTHLGMKVTTTHGYRARRRGAAKGGRELHSHDGHPRNDHKDGGHGLAREGAPQVEALDEADKRDDEQLSNLQGARQTEGLGGGW